MSDLERLKSLLLLPERGDIAQLQARLDSVDQARAALPVDLPSLLEQAQRTGAPGRLGKAIAGPVADALAEAVSHRRQSIVDALFPIIMPAIRKAIAESLRVLSTDINSLLESSFTPRGIRWRIESWRTGVPYAQIAIKGSLRYRVDHLLLIQRDTGLVLDRESAADLPDLDGDAIAGMLTAIGDFVRDSVAAEGGDSLTSATVGEYLLWVLEGPRAKLAAFIRGVPPESLKNELQTRLEGLHARFGDELALDPEQLVGLPEIKDALTPDDLRSSEPTPMSSSGSLRTVWILLAVVLLIALSWLAISWRWQVRLDAAEARLRTWPGFHLTAMQSRTWRSVSVEGLLDPIASPPLPMLRDELFPDQNVMLNTRGYFSTDPEMAALRLRGLLAAPASVDIKIIDGVASLYGDASVVWRDGLRHELALLAGINRIDSSQLRADLAASVVDAIGMPAGVTITRGESGWLLTGSSDSTWRKSLSGLLKRYPEFGVIDDSAFVVSEMESLDRINARLLQMPVRFVAGTVMVAGGEAAIDEYRQHLDEARQLARKLGKRLIVDVHGLNDVPGTDGQNADVRQRRAEFLVERLRADDGELIGFEIHADATLLVATIRSRAVLAQMRFE